MNSGSGVATARQELARSWPILMGAFLGISGGVSALPYYTQGLFVSPLTNEFGWSREQLSFVTLAGGMILAFASPLVGALVDRVGVRIPLLCSFAAMVLGYISLSLVGESFPHFLSLQMFVFAAGAVTGPVALTRMVNQRFVAMRGLALGITLAGSGAMAVMAPPVLARAIATIGWRGAYQVIAVAMAVAGTLALILLWPAGGRSEPLKADRRTNDADAEERTDVFLFWRLLVTFVCLALGVGGFAFHLVPLLLDAGVPLARAAGVQSVIGLSILAGRVGSGYLFDRFFAPHVSALVLSFAAAGLAGLASLGPVAAPACALLVGFALGAEGDLIGYLIARYFGLRRYGRLVGLLYGVFTLGLGLSPVLMSRMQETSGSYSEALWTSFGSLALAAISMVTLPRFGSGK